MDMPGCNASAARQQHHGAGPAAAARALTDVAELHIGQLHAGEVALVSRRVPHLHLDARALQDAHPLGRLRLARVCSGAAGSSRAAAAVTPGPAAACEQPLQAGSASAGLRCAAWGAGAERWCLPPRAAAPPAACCPTSPHCTHPPRHATHPGTGAPRSCPGPQWTHSSAPWLAAAAVACTGRNNGLFAARRRGRALIGLLASPAGVGSHAAVQRAATLYKIIVLSAD